ncbi:MAG TPA: GNAT family N-acetyltransferase [Lacipirellulaceae bacterium]|nr:GNAT family N-acetyltransferase [Lacipirellulaceae bacterium]
MPDSPTQGYNETTTRAFMHLILATMNAYDGSHPTPDGDRFCDTHPQLMSRHVLRLFYSPQQRMNRQAKTEFVHPDLAPLPALFPPDDVTITIERPDSPDAACLIEELETHLGSLYPPECRHGFSVERLIAESVAFFVLRVRGEAAGCGGIKLFDREYGEVKRLYVRPKFRGCGFGTLILSRLGEHALTEGITTLRLETGAHQTEAIQLYEREGFRRIPLFGPYTNSPESLYYEKLIEPNESKKQGVVGRR